MPQECRNDYRIARESAGFTQERAAELLDISVKSLQMYENGTRIPPNPVVGRMAEVYNTQFLAYQHVKKSSEEGGIVLPDVEPLPLPKAVLNLQYELRQLDDVMATLVYIGRRGRVEENEQEQWEKIEETTRRVTAALMGITYAIHE